MAEVNVICRTIMPGDGIEVPVRDLSSLFGTSGIDLKCQLGEPFWFDPASHPVTTYDSIVGQLSVNQEVGSPGYLLLGMRHPLYPENVPGQLLDLNRRGVAAVFRYSNYIRSGGAPALLQTCAHEIGHMLNLGHHDVGEQYVSVMNQADDRTQPVRVSWELAEQEAAVHRSQGTPDPFRMPDHSLGCHPFAFPARWHLDRDPTVSVLPWGSQFDHANDGSNDRWHMSPALQVVPEVSSLIEGGVFPFSVQLRAPRDRPVLVPAVFGPEFDNMILTVIRPDGTRHQHSPRTLNCPAGHAVIPAGGRTSRSFCTIRGPDGTIFPKPGRYQVEVALPGQGVSSPRIELQVDARKGHALARNGFQNLAAEAARRGSAAHEMLAKSVAVEAGIELPTRCYLALQAALAAPNAPAAAGLRAVALSPHAPTEVRHAAIMAEARARCVDGALTRSEVAELADRHLLQGEEYVLAALEGVFVR